MEDGARSQLGAMVMIQNSFCSSTGEPRHQKYFLVSKDELQYIYAE